MVTLKGNVRRDLTPDKDLGIVEDSNPQRLYLSLKRTPAQQADLDSLLSAQQNPASASYHKWLTPEQFGERFGVAVSDIAKISQWLELQGFEVTSVAKNASIINFMATAGGVRNTFHAQLHYFNVAGSKYTATTAEPQIPAALAGVVAGVAGLNKIPMHGHHTAVTQQAYDAETHKWHTVDAEATVAIRRGEKPHYTDGNGNYNMTPQDFYTIYNVNPTFMTGNTGTGGTVAIIAEQDMMYGTVNSTTGQATGGDVVTFRNLFGVKQPLNMTVQHGDTNFPCSDPGGDSGETALDAEWSSSMAPSAHLIVETCSPATGGSLTDFQTLVDANVADVISSSLGSPESAGADNNAFDTVFQQAAAQGQTIMVAEGDSGSDDIDFGTSGPATHGLSIDFPGSSPFVLSIGGTDYQDKYDADRGGIPQSTYWGANSQYYGDALSYVPETVWEDGCSNTIIALDPNYGNGLSPSAYCATGALDGVEGGGEGGISINYARPSYQSGVPGLSSSITKRVTPDISGFAGGGFWGHANILCDSGDPNSACTSPTTFGGAGGTSFASPALAGIFTLLKVGTGSRQGLVQPVLYALAEAQYSAGTACYANGQASNTGITKSLPAASCIFHDVTTGDNDNACVPGSTNCYTPSGKSVGILTASGNNSTLALAWPSGVGYDIATGLGSVNVTNLINNWGQAFSSSTGLTANPTAITTTQSTTLTATVTGGVPTGSSGQSAAVTGSISFTAGSVSLGSCMVNAGMCAIAVSGSALQSGENSVVATYSGNGTYPGSMSSIVTVTVTNTTGDTITALTASPASPAIAGTVVTLTASVTAAGAAVTSGTIKFYDTSVTPTLLLGTAELNTTGMAILKLTPRVGSHTFVAQFQGTTALPGKTMAQAPFVITAAGTYTTVAALTSTGSGGTYDLTDTATFYGQALPGGTIRFTDTTTGKALGTVSLGALTQTLSAPVTTTATAGSSALSSATGDFNADGIPDLAVTNVADNTVTILIGKADGTFKPAVTYATGDGPYAIQVGDFDRDGIQDLAIANVLGNTVSVLIGKADGTFKAQTTYAVGTYPFSLALADLNGDGIADLAVGNLGDNTVSILLGKLNGTFAAQTTVATGKDPAAVVAADFNADGKMDLAVVNEGDTTMGILNGNGDGTFQTATTYATGADPYAMTAGDFNGDGKMDLAVTNFAGKGISVYLNQGTGTFAPQAVYATGREPSSVVDYALDGSGKVSLAVANFGDNTISVLAANGDGTFQAQTTYASTTEAYSLTVGDFNGDGKADLAVTASDSTLLAVQSGTQTAVVSLNNVTLAAPPGSHTVTAKYVVGTGDAYKTSSSSIALTSTAGTVAPKK